MTYYDDGLMRGAIAVDELKTKGYLNRHTGEIAFVDANESYSGIDVAVDCVFNRATVEANPNDWIEIPKNIHLPVFHNDWCDCRTVRGLPCNCGGLERARTEEKDDDKFIADFLKEHGLVMEGQ